MPNDCTDFEVIQLLRAVYCLPDQDDHVFGTVDPLPVMTPQHQKLIEALLDRAISWSNRKTTEQQVLAVLDFGEANLERCRDVHYAIWVIDAARRLLTSLTDGR